VDGRCCAVVEGFRYPAEVISHCLWLYHRFSLSFREVEELMMERGVVASYETIRRVDDLAGGDSCAANGVVVP
jgi:transposase-like protein